MNCYICNGKDDVAYCGMCGVDLCGYCRSRIDIRSVEFVKKYKNKAMATVKHILGRE